MLSIKAYRNEYLEALITGVHIRVRFDKPTQEQIKVRTLKKYRQVFQLMILGEKYSVITEITGVKEKHIAMLVERYAPHLLRGKGNRKKEIVEPCEKTWNPETLKYELI